jgi:hypothetical protein
MLGSYIGEPEQISTSGVGGAAVVGGGGAVVVVVGCNVVEVVVATMRTCFL